MLWDANEFLILLLALLCFFIGMECAYRFGLRQARRLVQGETVHLGMLQSAVLGLLGLLFGFSLTMAVARYEERKALVVRETNDLGTLALRTRFLPKERHPLVLDLIRQYVDVRIQTHDSANDRASLEEAYRRAGILETKLWDHATEVAAADAKSVPHGLFIESLNAVIDDFEVRRAAFENHVPDTVVILLFATSLLALSFVAYGCGLSRKRRFATTSIVAVLFGLVLTIILDIDRPLRGFVRVKQDSMLRLRESLAEPRKLEPLPAAAESH